LPEWAGKSTSYDMGLIILIVVILLLVGAFPTGGYGYGYRSHGILGTVLIIVLILYLLDKSRAWNSLDDQLYCTSCKTIISGRQIEVVGGTNGLRALHLKCSTPGCFSTPADWILPVKSDTVREIDFLFRDDGF